MLQYRMISNEPGFPVWAERQWLTSTMYEIVDMVVSIYCVRMRFDLNSKLNARDGSKLLILWKDSEWRVIEMRSL